MLAHRRENGKPEGRLCQFKSDCSASLWTVHYHCKRKSLAIGTKLQTFYKKDKSKTRIPKRYGVPCSTMSTLFINKEARGQARGTFSPAPKLLGTPKYLFVWFKDGRAQKVPLSGSMLQDPGTDNHKQFIRRTTKSKTRVQNIHRHFESMSNTHQYFPYVNAIHILASNKELNSKKKRPVTDFLVTVIIIKL